MKAQPLTIDPIGADGWRAWRALRLLALEEAPYAFGSRLEEWQGEGDREERWRARLSIPGAIHLIARLDGTAVGMASGIPGETAGRAELISMYVSAAGRGRGVGAALVRRIVEWAAAGGSSALELDVFEDNARAIALYERCGFVATGTNSDHERGREIRMRSTLR